MGVGCRCCVLLRVGPCFLSHAWALLLIASLLLKAKGLPPLDCGFSEIPFLGD